MPTISVNSYLKWTALIHFKRTDPARLDSVPKAVWRDVADVMLQLPDWSERNLATEVDLVARVVREVSTSVEAALETALREPMDQGISFTRKLRKAWNARLTRIALNWITSGGAPQVGMRDILASLLMSGRGEAKEFALQAVATRREQNRSVAVASAQALMATGTDSDFASIWPLVVSEVPLGLEILGGDPPRSESNPVPLLARLREDQVAALYLWLSVNRRQPSPNQFGFVGPNERLEELERHCLDRLRTAGTLAAVQAIERIRQARPQAQWLRMVEDDAQRALRTSPGVRPTPLEILRMADDQSKRYISSEESLLQAVVTSLDGLQAELSGDDPLVRFLWSLKPPVPREELDLSTFVAGHLRRDLTSRGVVLNREVTVSRINRTDIRVEAIAQDQLQRPIVITVEVKGSWHDDLMTGMERQLRDRYLATGTGKVGLYLVGWFKTEGVERRGPRLTIEEARSAFAQQAEELSTEPFLIRAYVLDCRWREEVPDNKPKTSDRAGTKRSARKEARGTPRPVT
jgi:hypothetical protein